VACIIPGSHRVILTKAEEAKVPKTRRMGAGGSQEAEIRDQAWGHSSLVRGNAACEATIYGHLGRSFAAT